MPVRSFELDHITFLDGARATGEFGLFADGSLFTSGIQIGGPGGAFDIVGALAYGSATRILTWVDVIAPGSPPVESVLSLQFFDDLASWSLPLERMGINGIDGHSFYGHDIAIGTFPLGIGLETGSVLARTVAERSALALSAIALAVLVSPWLSRRCRTRRVVLDA